MSEDDEEKGIVPAVARFEVSAPRVTALPELSRQRRDAFVVELPPVGLATAGMTHRCGVVDCRPGGGSRFTISCRQRRW
jgi:hypothetical protein